MDTIHLKQLVDGCFLAKRIVETLPALPKGMKPRHIHVLDAVYETVNNQGMCRVSDVSARLNITTPSISKLIHELEDMQMLDKYTDAADKRVTLLSLTEEGMACVKKHVLDFQKEWTERIPEIDNEQAKETVRILTALLSSMPRGGADDGK